jgi:hypothetical protein
MREMKAARNTNPAGREGRPISLHPLKPKDALRGLMMVKPPPRAEKSGTSKSVKSRGKRK